MVNAVEGDFVGSVLASLDLDLVTIEVAVRSPCRLSTRSPSVPFVLGVNGARLKSLPVDILWSGTLTIGVCSGEGENGSEDSACSDVRSTGVKVSDPDSPLNLLLELVEGD